MLGDEATPAGEDRYAHGLVIETCSMTLTRGIALAHDRLFDLIRKPDNVNYRDSVSGVEWAKFSLLERAGARGT